jgi:Flp pilus assembly protein TadB
MSRLGDRVLLVLAALVLAGGAWAMLHYSGEWFFPVASIIVLILLVVQNQRLKRRLKGEAEREPRRKSKA